MKKLKKLLSALGAVTVCAVSLSPLFSNAKIGGWMYAPDNTVTPYTTSFTAMGDKYTLWQEATDYFGNKDFKVYISTKSTDPDGREYYDAMSSYHQIYYSVSLDKMIDRCEVCPLYVDESYHFETEEDMEKLLSYLSENNIPYRFSEYNDMTVVLMLNDGNMLDYMQTYIDIKENTGFVLNWGLVESAVQIESAESAFPEKTLEGDANEDGVVDIADAAAIIQHLGNRDKYGLSMQGIVNADFNGDGVTGEDALTIQRKVAQSRMPK